MEGFISKEVFDALNEKYTALENELITEKAAKATIEVLLNTEKESHLATMQVNEGLQQQIEQLEQAGKNPAKVAKEKVTKIPDASFKVNKLEYVITVPAFHYDGNKITAEQLLEDKKLQAILVEEGVGFIVLKGA